MRGWREAAGGMSQPGERTRDISEAFKCFALQQGTRPQNAVRYHTSWQQSLAAPCVVTVLKMFVSQFLVSCCPGVVPHYADGWHLVGLKCSWLPAATQAPPAHPCNRSKDWGWDSKQLGLRARADLDISPCLKFARGCDKDWEGWWIYKRQSEREGEEKQRCHLAPSSLPGPFQIKHDVEHHSAQGDMFCM